MTDEKSKSMHAQRQKELMDKIAELEKSITNEDEVVKAEASKLEKRGTEIEYEIKDLESAYEAMKQDKFIERQAEQQRQLKQLEVNDRIIVELKKENKKLRQQQAKAHDKLDKLTGTSQKIEEMNLSLSDLCENISNLAEVAETTYESLQEDHDTTRETNNGMKSKLRSMQDEYWAVAQSRLEYQKGLAKILTLVQAHMASKSASDAIKDAAQEMTTIALHVENQAKVQMAAVDAEVAGKM